MKYVIRNKTTGMFFRQLKYTEFARTYKEKVGHFTGDINKAYTFLAPLSAKSFVEYYIALEDEPYRRFATGNYDAPPVPPKPASISRLNEYESVPCVQECIPLDHLSVGIGDV